MCRDEQTAPGPEKVNQVSLKHKDKALISVYWRVSQYKE